MKTLIQYINEGILGDIDDTLNAADENTERYLIANWLNENLDCVVMFANRVSDFTASTSSALSKTDFFAAQETKKTEIRSNNTLFITLT